MIKKQRVRELSIVCVIVLIYLMIVGFYFYKGGLFLSPGEHISGRSDYNGLIVSIDQKEGNIIKLSFDNTSDTDMNIGGWGSPQRVCLTTTEGEYWYDFNKHMGFTIKGHTKTRALLPFSGVKGKFINLRIDRIQTLVGGLPTFGEKCIVEIPIIYDEGA